MVFSSAFMKKLAPAISLIMFLALFAFPSLADTPAHPVIIYDGKSTELSAASPFTQSQDLWVTFADLTRATGFEVKPQGVCRRELCFPIPSSRTSEFLSKRGNLNWFNISVFARLLKQPVARDASLNAWYFGPRPATQNEFLSSLEAPNFTLPDMNGKQHSLADFRGKKVLIVTWASW
jgi:hypothetical protein